MPAEAQAKSAGVAVARDYYDSSDAIEFYSTIWGGEDIHVGIYDDTRDIREASAKTVDTMAGLLGDLSDARVLDIGSGYGGGARRLVTKHGARSVVCLNIAEEENARNRKLTGEAGLSDRIDVVDGSFDALPFGDAGFDVVWSQDAILHAPDRGAVLDEVARVLKSGGRFVFTDPMQADGLSDTGALQPIYDRIHLENLASFAFYREGLKARGLAEIEVQDRSGELRNHYARVAEELDARRDELSASDAFVDRMITGLGHWVRGADEGRLTWGIMLFRKA
ncbi:methyltransferase domain-containing protein [Erythrobacter sp. HL-111]|uniref:methyltransferase domain-containing protein n=1 Tax=Erythrobacter sp. HL-111 TaxID=1798193 RepID=UPI0006DA1429|nr:methyltransferase domain-containing protein [Erythrobacter sp. HL-111]KPP95062.1 MAG: sarcosine dimethylglycine N-methyltransferase Sdm [Erythrobacteraceae bacterium HL-111]SDS09123.1 sarcosine/dimethylglycine N-methyltransferase [Erythrobacter sp. HL-111]